MTTADIGSGVEGSVDASPLRPMQASLAARLAGGTDLCALTFAGQGWAWWDALPALLDQRDDLGRPARLWASVIADLLRSPEYRDQGRVPVAFDPVGWATGLREIPDPGQMTTTAMSFVGCLYTQLLGYRALWNDGLAAVVSAGAIQAAAGHSAGVLAASAISEQPDGLPRRRPHRRASGAGAPARPHVVGPPARHRTGAARRGHAR